MAQTKVLFIDEAYIRDVLPIDVNIDSKFIVPAIMKSQDNQIKQLIGTSVYIKLVAEISASTINNDVNYSEMYYDYLKICHAYYTLYELADFLHYKITNKGIEKQKSDTSEPITRAEMQDYKNRVLDYCKYYGQRLSLFMIARPSKFPEYTNPALLNNNQLDTIFPDRNGYTNPAGLLIPNRKRSRLIGFDYPNNR